jgi:alkanesulfonate monooxygenase SsuD/methylene tetrahydromethanopterin reductase-like flavin-dependent oxidoreductase (luciferase family)
MKYSLVMFPTDYSIHPAELARAAEDRGFESLFFPEHTHIPASRRTPYPGGGELPTEYSHSHDPFVALAMASSAPLPLMRSTG